MTTERPHQIGVRFSTEEHQMLVKAAEAEGLRPATYVRRLVLLALRDSNPQN